MIIGTGIDIIEVERVSKAIERWGDGFLHHVFTDSEIAYARQHRYPNQHFAARFAAKEAVLKAFGDNAHISWKDIQITNDKDGKPVCIYHNKKFKDEILISISHTHAYAVASAIITKNPSRSQK
jgi:holo-[acyl-carrier protein] synthase